MDSWAAMERPAFPAPPTRRFDFGAPLTGLVFTRAGRHVAAALGDGTVRIVDRDDAQRETTVIVAHDGAALCLEQDIAADAVLSGGDDGSLVSCTVGGASQALLQAPGHWVDTIAVSDTLRAVAIGKEVRVIDGGGREAGRSADHPSTISGLSFNAKGKRIAVSHYGGITLWWTSSLDKMPKRYRWPGSHIGVSWSPDGLHVMTATQENELHGWRLADGADMRMSGYARKVRSLGWTRTPRYLLSAGAENVIAWPFSGRGPAGRAPLEFGRKGRTKVTRVAAHPRLPLVAFGYDEGEVRLADLPEMRMVSLVPAGEGMVSCLAFSPDGAFLAAGFQNGAICLIDLMTSVAGAARPSLRPPSIDADM